MSSKIEVDRQTLIRAMNIEDVEDRFKAIHELRTLLAAPVVERQPVAWRTGLIVWPFKTNAIIHARNHGLEIEPLYTAPPELAELQATIVQQRSLIESLRNDMLEAISIDCGDDAIAAMAEVERFGIPGDVIREMNDELVDLRAEIERLKSTNQ